MPKLWRILASHKDQSFTLTDFEDYTDAGAGDYLIRAVGSRLLFTDFAPDQPSLARYASWQNGDEGLYLESITQLPPTSLVLDLARLDSVTISQLRGGLAYDADDASQPYTHEERVALAATLSAELRRRDELHQAQGGTP